MKLGILAVVIAVPFLAGCGGEKTDVSGGVDQLQSQVLEPIGVTIDCPDEVDGGEGTDFDCTLSGEGGEVETTLTVDKEGDDLVVNPADQAAYEAAVQEAAGGGGGGGGGAEGE